MLIWDTDSIGRETSRYKGVAAYENGYLFHRSQGRHYSEDGYYYGQKWQCVEYIKRFYKIVLHHEMPDVWGHARSFFDPSLADGALNPARGLRQYHNGSSVAPRPDDILVFRDTQYGHMGIITRVSAQEVEIIQQNIFGKPRQCFRLTCEAGRYRICRPRQAAGWMRK